MLTALSYIIIMTNISIAHLILASARLGDASKAHKMWEKDRELFVFKGNIS